MLLLLILMLFWWQARGTLVCVSLNRCLIKLIIVKSSISRPSCAKSTRFVTIEAMITQLGCGRRLADIKVIMDVTGAASSSHT